MIQVYTVIVLFFIGNAYSTMSSARIDGICPGKMPEKAMVGDSCGIPDFINAGMFGNNSDTTGTMFVKSSRKGLSLNIYLKNLPRSDLVLTAWLVWVPGGVTKPSIFEIANHASPCAPFTAPFSSGLGYEPNSFKYVSKRTAHLSTMLNFNPTYPKEGALTRETFHYQRDVPGIQSTNLKQYPTKDDVYIPTSSTYIRRYDRNTGFEKMTNGRPMIVRSPVKAMGVEVIAHVDKTTHGVSQGVGGVDHYMIIFFPFKDSIGRRTTPDSI